MNLEKLVTCVEDIARKKHDGHLTIMKFTTGWKAFFGTPDLDSGKGRLWIFTLKSFETIEDALLNCLICQGDSND